MADSLPSQTRLKPLKAIERLLNWKKRCMRLIINTIPMEPLRKTLLFLLRFDNGENQGSITVSQVNAGSKKSPRSKCWDFGFKCPTVWNSNTEAVPKELMDRKRETANSVLMKTSGATFWSWSFGFGCSCSQSQTTEGFPIHLQADVLIEFYSCNREEKTTEKASFPPLQMDCVNCTGVAAEMLSKAIDKLGLVTVKNIKFCEKSSINF